MITVSGIQASFEHRGEKYYALLWADGTVAIWSVDHGSALANFVGYAHELA